MSRIDELLAQRESIDDELQSLKADAEKELQAAKDRVAVLQAALSFNKSQVTHAQSLPRTAIDETDAGMGVDEQVDGVSAEDFRGELHMLRKRTLEKRRKLQ